MIRREAQALPTRLLKAPEPTEQGTEAASQPGHGEEQRLKGVEGAKLLCLHSQAPTASEEGTTVTQKWPIRNTRSTSPANIRVLTNKGKIMLVKDLSLKLYSHSLASTFYVD